MTNYRGTGILAIKKIMKKNGEEVEKKFLSQLTQEEKNVLDACRATTWVPIDVALSISAKAARVIFPNDPEYLFKFGMERARIQVSRVYKIIFSIFTLKTCIANYALFWSGLHDQGIAHVEKGGKPNEVIYCVAGYPDLHPDFRKMITGYILALMESAGQKNVAVVLDESNPQLWKWKIVCEEMHQPWDS